MSHLQPRTSLLITLAALAWLGASHTLRADTPIKTIQLFNGKDLTGWRLHGDASQSYWKVGTASLDPADPSKIIVKPGGSDLINAGYHGIDIYSEASFGDAIVELEVMVPRNSNSGVVLMGTTEIQVLDSYGREKPKDDDMGAVYGLIAPKTNAAKKPGEWQTLMVEYRSPKFDAHDKKVVGGRIVKATLNGHVIHENAELKKITNAFLFDHEVSAGPVLLQGDHGPIAFRNIKITPVAQQSPGSAANVKTGGVQMITVDGSHRVWTKQVGRGAIKMLTCPGGPGGTHECFECFEDFLPQRGIQFYYYDQLGSAYSDQPDDASLWTIGRFRDEVEQVRVGLGLEKFYLFGHSWGAMQSIEYTLKYQQHLKGLIISNMAASCDSYMEHVNELRKQLPSEDIDVLDRCEAKNDFESPEYQQVMKRVYTKHLCRLEPWPEPVERCFRHLNTKIYNVMQGPSEFFVTGNLKHWNRWNDLPKIKVPTLLIGAKYDEMNPEDIRRMGKLIPRSRTVILENGSHLCLYDDQAAYFRALIQFLQDVENGRL